MANFTRIWALGLNLYDELTSAAMNAFDIAHTKAINGDDGSSHAPATQIVLAGAGLKMQGPTAFDTGSAPHVKTGVTLTVDSGGTCALAAGSTTTCLGLMQATPTAGSYLDLSGDLTNVLKCGGVTTLNELHAVQTTITGPTFRSGAFARAPHRYHALATSTPIAVDTTYDTYRVATTLGADQVLNVAVGLEVGDWMIFHRLGIPDAHKCTINFAGAGTAVETMNNSQAVFLHMIWDGAGWQPIASSPAMADFV